MAISYGFWEDNMEGTKERMNRSLVVWGLKSERPAVAAAWKGCQYYATDEEVTYFCDGSTWKPHATPGYTVKDIKVYPDGSAGVSCSSTATAWQWGSWVELVPASTITNDFVITHVKFNIPDMTEGQLDFGVGGSGSDVGGKIRLPY